MHFCLTCYAVESGIDVQNNAEFMSQKFMENHKIFSSFVKTFAKVLLIFAIFLQQH